MPIPLSSGQFVVSVTEELGLLCAFFGQLAAICSAWRSCYIVIARLTDLLICNI